MIESMGLGIVTILFWAASTEAYAAAVAFGLFILKELLLFLQH